jgi:hypothetical protein
MLFHVQPALLVIALTHCVRWGGDGLNEPNRTSVGLSMWRSAHNRLRVDACRGQHGMRSVAARPSGHRSAGMRG